MLLLDPGHVYVETFPVHAYDYCTPLEPGDYELFVEVKASAGRGTGASWGVPVQRTLTITSETADPVSCGGKTARPPATERPTQG